MGLYILRALTCIASARWSGIRHGMAYGADGVSILSAACSNFLYAACRECPKNEGRDDAICSTMKLCVTKREKEKLAKG